VLVKFLRRSVVANLEESAIRNPNPQSPIANVNRQSAVGSRQLKVV
jgi:hypothetical protein